MISVCTSEGDARVFEMTTQTTLRGVPIPARRIVESGPSLHSGNDALDALFALAVEEARENSVDAIQDGSFANGQPVPCGGCFETGKLWNYVWTRDTAYAVDLGLAWLDPPRARNSLLFKVSQRRGGGAPEIVQDTGTGGGYPVSTDRVVWALGAERVAPYLPEGERQAFEATAYEALKNTVETDRRLVFDDVDGLYTGETSFLDWREQTYPAWTAQDVGLIAQSKALSTNVLHLRALKYVARLAQTYGDPQDATRYADWAEGLRLAIRKGFLGDSPRSLGTTIGPALAPAVSGQRDALALALATVSDVITLDEAVEGITSYPVYGDLSVVFPQQQFTRIYHNRAQWPFVTSYWLLAAKRANHLEAFERSMRTLIGGASTYLSNMENFDAQTGRAWVEDGEYSGPVVNSPRQLWSVAGFLGMVYDGLFGVRFDGEALEFSPYVPGNLSWFAGQRKLTLKNLQFHKKTLTVDLELPPSFAGPMVLDHVRIHETRVERVVVSELEDDATISVVLKPYPNDSAGAATEQTVVDPQDWTQIYAPRTPRITDVSRTQDGQIRVTWDRGDEVEPVLFDVARDGVTVARDIAGTTWTDALADPEKSWCYTVESRFEQGENRSHWSQVQCWWGENYRNIWNFFPRDFTSYVGRWGEDHGRTHVALTQANDHIELGPFQPQRSGRHWLQATFGNGAARVDTGIACGVLRVDLVDATTNNVLKTGAWILPGHGSWDAWADSNLMEVDLDPARSYVVRASQNPDWTNMSYFEHFKDYSGGAGGLDGPANRVNIAAVKLLWKPQE